MRTLAIVSVTLALLSVTASNAAELADQSTRSARNLPVPVQGQDVEQLAFSVLLQAAQSAQEDLKAVMANVKAINRTKALLRQHMSDARVLPPSPCFGAAALRDCIRQTQQKLTKMELASLDLMRASVLATQGYATLLTDSLRHAPEEADRRHNNLPPPARIIPVNPCRGWNVTFWKECIVLMKVELAGNLPDANSQAAVDAELDAIKQSLDSMSELGETESLRLQMAMDRMSKLMSTLSNILKKISDTQQSITQNLK
jgi:hypothetical protein